MASSSAEAEWRAKFTAAISNLGGGMTYTQAADGLRQVISAGVLEITDIRDRPERFFEAHRILAAHTTRLCPGFFVRFTVHFNLYAGTVVALGTPAQLNSLRDRMRQRPRLGCFGLTECLAGVNSGLVVETTAEFENGQFVINTPSDGAAKNWISQGLMADEAIVVADLTVAGKNYGPQAFLIQMRDADGKLAPGILAEDMGRKTIANDLDNARLKFTSMKVPLDAMLARYLRIYPDGRVEQPGVARKSMEMIGQRLFTGRVGVAIAALQFASGLFAATKSFADNKTCWAPDGRRPALSEVPQIRAIFQNGDAELQRLARYTSEVEARLNDHLRADRIPPLALQQAVAVCKVKAVEDSIALCFALKQEVGSHALMAGTGFEQMDFLQTCKFAEGDTRILMQKMARDLVRAGPAKAATSGEKAALAMLGEAMAREMKANGGDKTKAWDSCYKLVYALADAHMLGVMESFGLAPPPTSRL